MLAEVKRQIGVPVLTDVHAEDEVAEVAAVVDVLQTPAFLCRQTDFIQAAAAAGKPVNIKKGQFLAPEDMTNVVAKASEASGADNITGVRARRVVRLSQPGVRHALARDHARHRLSGGVRRDALGAAARRAGHDVRRPARVRPRAGACRGRGGRRRHFHGDASRIPRKALSDGPNAWPLDRMQALLRTLVAIDRAVKREAFAESDLMVAAH